VTLLKIRRSRDSYVGVAITIRTELPRSLGSIPGSTKHFSLLHSAQTGSGVLPTFYTMGTWGSLPGGKQLGCKADNLPPSSAKVKNAYSYTTTSPYILMVHCLIKNKDNNLFLMYNKETALTGRVGNGLTFSGHND
jgi:hypothetical protein